MTLSTLLAFGLAAGVAWLLARALLVWVYKLGFQRYWKKQLLLNTPDAITLVIFGDSISQGVGATRWELTLVGRVAAYIQEATGRPVIVKNYSRSGATADQVLTEQIPKADLEGADIILLEIGANDTFRRTPDQYAEDVKEIVAQLPLEKSVIADLPYVKIRRPYQKALENALKGKLAARAVVSTEFESFLRSLPVTAGDFFHPSNKGYALWFKAFRPGIDDVLRRHSLLKAKK